MSWRQPSIPENFFHTSITTILSPSRFSTGHIPYRFPWVALTRLTPKMLRKTRASIFKMIFFLGKNGSDNTCTFSNVSFHFCRCYFTCDLIVGSICLLISGYIFVEVGSTDPSNPSSLIKRREEKVGVSLWVTVHVNVKDENHWFVPQAWEESGLMYLALLLRTPSTAGDRN